VFSDTLQRLSFQLTGILHTPKIIGQMNRRWFVMLCTENPSPLHFQEKEELRLQDNQRALVIYDQFKGQVTGEIFKLLES